MRRARLSTGEIDLALTLRDTPTANRIWTLLPIEGSAQSWGEEVYLSSVGARCSLEADASDLLQEGEIAYWAEGDAIAVCYGETPISAPGEMRLISPANIWADCDEDLTLLSEVRPGDAIRLEKLDG